MALEECEEEESYAIVGVIENPRIWFWVVEYYRESIKSQILEEGTSILHFLLVLGGLKQVALGVD